MQLNALPPPANKGCKILSTMSRIGDASDTHYRHDVLADLACVGAWGVPKRRGMNKQVSSPLNVVQLGHVEASRVLHNPGHLRAASTYQGLKTNAEASPANVTSHLFLGAEAPVMMLGTYTFPSIHITQMGMDLHATQHGAQGTAHQHLAQI